MKFKTLTIGAIIMASLTIVATAMQMGYNLGLYSQQQKIDLPEEIKAISADEKNPDTLTGYQHNNVLYINFKH